MVFIGIDPGLTGAIAFLVGPRYLVFDTPTVDQGGTLRCNPYEMSRIIRKHAPGIEAPRAAIELAQSAPDQSPVSSFNYATGYGMWLGALAAEEIEYVEPRPQEWMAMVFGSRRDKTVSTKTRSLEKARAMFPHAALTLQKHHGRAEALLIAHWLRMQHER